MFSHQQKEYSQNSESFFGKFIIVVKHIYFGISMPRKIEKIYSGDRLVKIRILPKVKKEIKKIEEKGEEVKEKVIEVGEDIGEKTEEKKESVKEEISKIEKKTEEKIAEVKEKVEMTVDDAVTVFTKIPGVTKEKAKMLYNAGFTSLNDLASAPAESLLKIRNITLENVKNIKKELKDFYEEEVKSQIKKIEKTPVEKSMAWVEDVTKKMFSVGKDSLKKAKTGAFFAKDRVSETYRKLTAPEKTEKEEKKMKAVQKKKTVKPVKKKTKRKTKKSGRK
jgi:hypothetical protein